MFKINFISFLILLKEIKSFFRIFIVAVNCNGVKYAIGYIPVYIMGKMNIYFRNKFIKKSILDRKSIKISYGYDFPEKTFYLININEGWCGLFAILAHQITHIAFAVDNEMIPVVDLQNNPSQYLESCRLFKENAWEYFFEQPCGYSLSDIKKAKNIVINIPTESNMQTHDINSIYWFMYGDYNSKLINNFMQSPYIQQQLHCDLIHDTQTCGKPPTCFGPCFGHLQGGIQQKKILQ